MWTWKESGGSPPSMRVLRTALAFVPAPPATAWLTTSHCGFSLLNWSISSLRPAASPPVVHHEKTSTFVAPLPPPPLAAGDAADEQALNAIASAPSRASRERTELGSITFLPPLLLETRTGMRLALAGPEARTTVRPLPSRDRAARRYVPIRPMSTRMGAPARRGGLCVGDGQADLEAGAAGRTVAGEDRP